MHHLVELKHHDRSYTVVSLTATYFYFYFYINVMLSVMTSEYHHAVYFIVCITSAVFMIVTGHVKHQQ